MDRKKMIELVGSLFVALIFLTSYAAFGNSGNQGGRTTTSTIPQTIYGTGQSQADIVSYGSLLVVNISCANVSSVSTDMNNALVSLERNGSVSNFYSPESSQIIIQPGNETAYGIYTLLASHLDQNTVCTSFASQARIQLPSSISFYLPAERSSVSISIPSGLRSYSIPISFSANMSSKVNVSVAALITLNETIYGNMSVKRV